MEKELIRSIFIEASPEDIWDTLTHPDRIREYMYGAYTDTDWQPGSPVNYYIDKDGQQLHVVTGRVLQNEAPHLLVHTLFPVGWPMEDIPENYIHCHYRLTPRGNGTELTTIQHDFSAIALGERRYKDSVNGWSVVLPKLKHVAESHRS